MRRRGLFAGIAALLAAPGAAAARRPATGGFVGDSLVPLDSAWLRLLPGEIPPGSLRPMKLTLNRAAADAVIESLRAPSGAVRRQGRCIPLREFQAFLREGIGGRAAQKAWPLPRSDEARRLGREAASDEGWPLPIGCAAWLEDSAVSAYVPGASDL